MTKFLINCLEIKEFDFRNFEDPAHGQFYSVLEAIALGYNQPEKI